MTEERLTLLSDEELTEIAVKKNVFISDEYSREEVIALILDSEEEEHSDRLAQQNLAVRMEGTKFSLSLDDVDLYDFSENEVTLPERYNETRIVMLQRDPSWVYVYWDISDSKVAEMKRSSLFREFNLRIYELDEKHFRKDNIIMQFDLPITLNDKRRYINLPGKDSYFCASLVAVFNEREEEILRSNIIHMQYDRNLMPNGSNAGNSDSFSLLTGLGIDSSIAFGGSSPSAIPQRIIPFDGDKVMKD